MMPPRGLDRGGQGPQGAARVRPRKTKSIVLSLLLLLLLLLVVVVVCSTIIMHNYCNII